MGVLPNLFFLQMWEERDGFKNDLRGLCSHVSLFGLLVCYCFVSGLLCPSLVLIFSFTPSPSLFKCGPINLCGKLGLAIAWKKGIIVPGEPRGRSTREEERAEATNNSAVSFCRTVAQRGGAQRRWEESWKCVASLPGQGWQRRRRRPN